MPAASFGLTFYAGATPIAELTTRDADGALETPTGSTLVHRDQDGTETSYTSPNAAITLGVTTGVSRFIFPSGLAAGKHVLHIRASGSATTAAKTVTFDVKPDGTTTL